MTAFARVSLTRTCQWHHVDVSTSAGHGPGKKVRMADSKTKKPRKVLMDDRLYFTDDERTPGIRIHRRLRLQRTAAYLLRLQVFGLGDGRIVCGRHAGMTAQYTGRDLSGQRILMVSKVVAKQWLANFGEPIKCEDCGGPVTEESDHDYTTGWGPVAQ